MKTYYKDKDAKKDYCNDWADWLNGDTIKTSTWTGITGVTKIMDSNTDTKATIWVEGGEVDVDGMAVNHIVSNDGREEDETLIFIITEK